MQQADSLEVMRRVAGHYKLPVGAAPTASEWRTAPEEAFEHASVRDAGPAAGEHIPERADAVNGFGVVFAIWASLLLVVRSRPSQRTAHSS